MEFLNKTLEAVCRNIAYAERIARWLSEQKLAANYKEMANRLSNALGTADCELSKFITYGISDVQDDGAKEAIRQISAKDKQVGGNDVGNHD